jgi:threonine synthase
MQLYSTKRISPNVNFEEAIFKGLPADNGLFMPKVIEKLSTVFWDNIQNLSLKEIAFEITKSLLSKELTDEVIHAIIDNAINFDAPTIKVTENIYALELFHGTSMAFKDFGARFMAATMSHFLKKERKNINILVATSGDTGGAVAQGFYKKENLSVTILYPKDKVSDIQEKQLTTLGHNIKAIEIDGTFDDCQVLVKTAFLDNELKSRFNIASANSINIARLIPQAFYYVYSYARLAHLGKEIVFSVPSGNFGNLTAGLIAMKLGMPVKKFLAVTNINNVVPNYLESGVYEPISPSFSTISNAMDVGNPSNFPRMLEMFDANHSKMKETIKGFYFNDLETQKGVKELNDDFDYLTCPHSAIAYLGLKEYLGNEKSNKIGVFLCTAHFGKFLPEMEKILGYTPDIPERLKELLELEKKSFELENDYLKFKDLLSKILI